MTEPLNILILGHGKMGDHHLSTVLAARDAGLPLNISVVDQKEQTDKGAPGPYLLAQQKLAGGKGEAFRSLDEALDSLEARGESLDVVLMAFNDRDHYPALMQLNRRTPDFRFLLSEKPLTETLAQAEELTGWLATKKVVSLNTVIHFSSVFDERDKLFLAGGLLYGATPMGLEMTWQKNRMSDTRPTTGIGSDLPHPLGIGMEPLGYGMIEFRTGILRRGFLSEGAPDVVHSLQDTEWRTSRGLPVRLNASYAARDQERSVTEWFAKGGSYLAVHMEYDADLGGKTRGDVLRVVELPMLGGEPRVIHGYVGRDEDIADYGVPLGKAMGKAQAWLGQSLKTVTTPGHPFSPRMTSLYASLELQRATEAVSLANPRLKAEVIHQPAAEWHQSFCQAPAATSMAMQMETNSLPSGWDKGNLERRISWLTSRYNWLDQRMARSRERSVAPA